MFSCIGVHIVAGRMKSEELSSCACANLQKMPRNKKLLDDKHICFGFHIAASCVFCRRHYFFLLTGRHVFSMWKHWANGRSNYKYRPIRICWFWKCVWICSSGFGMKHWRVSIQYSMYIRSVVWWLSEFIFAHITYSESFGEALKWGWVIELRKGDLQSSSLPPSLPPGQSETL
jgi:hypothetical protein